MDIFRSNIRKFYVFVDDFINTSHPHFFHSFSLSILLLKADECLSALVENGANILAMSTQNIFRQLTVNNTVRFGLEIFLYFRIYIKLKKDEFSSLIESLWVSRHHISNPANGRTLVRK